MRRARFSSGLLLPALASLVLATACDPALIDQDVKEGPDELSEEDRQYIDDVNADQDADISDTRGRVDALENTLANLYPVAAIDNKLSSSAVSAIFGTDSPTVDPDTGRKKDEQYVSVEQALRYLASRSSSGGSSGGSGGSATDVTYNPGGAANANQSFEAADSVEEALNALRWASQIRITQANTSWAGGNVASVQAALEDLDDRVSALGTSGGGGSSGSSGASGPVAASNVQAGPNATDTFGPGTYPWLDPSDNYPDINSATNVKQAINALRFINTDGTYFETSGHPLAYGYVSEAVLALDRRSNELETFISSYTQSSGSFVTADGVTFNANGLDIPNATQRDTSPYQLPLAGNTLTEVIQELTYIVEGNRWADRISVDFSQAPLNDSRWAPDSTIRDGQFRVGADGQYLDQVLRKIHEELDDLYTTVQNGGGGSSSSGGITGPIYAADVLYDPTTANSTLTFGGSTNVDQALGALRYSKNVKYNPTTANDTLVFSDAQYVEQAIGALRYSDQVKYDPTTANSALTFGTAGYVQDAIGALRYSSNVRYDPTTANSALVFENTTYVQDAIGALRYSSNVRFDPGTIPELSGANNVQVAITTLYQVTNAAIANIGTTLLNDNTFITNLSTAITNTAVFTTTVNNLISNYFANNQQNLQIDAQQVTINQLNPADFGGGDRADEALQYLENENDTQNADITAIRNVTDTTFRDNLRAFLDSYMGEQTVLQNIANNAFFYNALATNNQFIDALFNNTYFTNKLFEQGGGGGYILGPTDTTHTGAISVDTKVGLAAAAQLCVNKYAVSTAHVCSTVEAANAMAKGITGTVAAALAGGGQMWVWSPTVNVNANRTQTGDGGDTLVANCQDFLYQTNNVASGTYALWVANNQPTAGGLTGNVLAYRQVNGACQTQRKILCCR
ncbi:MAG: hypothetical protein AB2A00_08725 [Myxococcota bacterium]